MTQMNASTNDEMPAAFRWIFCFGFIVIGMVFLVLGGYPRGKEVEVFYDPDNPQSSVLIKGIGLSWLAVGLGGIAFILGLVVFIKTAKGARRNSERVVGNQL